MGYKSCPLISSIIYMKSIACSIQRPRRTAWEIKWHPRILTFPGIEPLLFLWPLEPLIKPILLSTWWMKAKVKEEQKRTKANVYGKTQASIYRKYLLPHVSCPFWILGFSKGNSSNFRKKNTNTQGPDFLSLFQEAFSHQSVSGSHTPAQKGWSIMFP